MWGLGSSDRKNDMAVLRISESLVYFILQCKWPFFVWHQIVLNGPKVRMRGNKMDRWSDEIRRHSD